MKFRKKPVVIEAIQWDGSRDRFNTIYEWANPSGDAISAPITSDGCFDSGDDVQNLCIDTLEGTMLARVGDWIIRGVKGEYYPCKPEVFAATYEPAEEA